MIFPFIWKLLMKELKVNSKIRTILRYKDDNLHDEEEEKFAKIADHDQNMLLIQRYLNFCSM